MTNNLQELLAYKKAENDRKSGNYEAALTYFIAAFNANPQPDTAWRRLYCLRRLGRFEEADQLGTQLVAQFPGSTMVRAERAWLIYDRDVRNPAFKDDPARRLEAVYRMLEYGDDPFVARKAVMEGAKAAREMQAWEQVIELCDRVQAKDFEANPRLINGRKIPGDREIYYFARLKALMQLKRFEETRQLALTAQNEFPFRVDYPRYAALALEGLGQTGQAIEELRRLAAKPKTQWYVLADLARLLVAADKPEEAWPVTCRAAASFGEPSAKVNLYTLMARITEVQGQPDVAARHALLSARVREEQGWRLPNDLSDLLLRLPLPEPHPDRRDLEHLCRADWEAALSGVDHGASTASAGAMTYGSMPGGAVSATAAAGAQRDPSQEEVLKTNVPGTVIIRQPEASFAFIRTESFSEPVFVLVKDLPEAARHDYDKRVHAHLIR
ncbi:MAG TPA: hypothetical protein PKO06_11945, partial [Candidatus Ozemobacteraceae bacterium]|nr:hypothetical protein [Candidatus Ozemobacteraceae bacterium]